MAKIAVIGGGLAGLAGAIRLARMGYDVELFEKNERLGGKMNELFLGPYRFDTGPSLITMPFIIDELFECAGVRRQDYFDFIPVDPMCRYFFPDGSVFNAYANQSKMKTELEHFSPTEIVSFEKFMLYAKRIYDITTDVFVLNSVHRLSRLLNWRTAKKLLQIRRIDAFRTVHEAVCHFYTDKRLIQIFDRYPTYNGSDPFKAPATLNTIPYVEYGIGGYYIRGGLYRLVEALVHLAQKLGVTIHTSAAVEKILHKNRKIIGIQVNGRKVPAGAILSNIDVIECFNTLISGYERTRDALNTLEPSLSGMLFFWGVRGRYDRLAHHNILFSEDYRREFRHIFDTLEPPDDPTVYIAITCKTDKDPAPTDAENWFVLVNMPYLKEGQDWPKAVDKTRQAVLEKLKKHGFDIRAKIEYEHVHTPEDLYRLYGSNRGSIYGISSNDRNMAFRRPANRFKKLKGLYFAGGSSHPGGGVPLVLQSGKIAAEWLAENVRRI